MKASGKLASVVILVITVTCLGAGWLAPKNYSTQFRDHIDSPPSKHFPLGTDELGRDRLSRVLYGGRISLLLAPTAALFSTLLAAIFGTVAGYYGGIAGGIISAVVDLFLSLPWFFLLVSARAALPLDLPPEGSAGVTFTLLGLLGWAASARVVCAGARTIRNSDFITTARACGCKPWRTLAIQLSPNLKPTLWAQFLVSIPAFILAEANLTMLGLGVTEPLPSWGSLLRELENADKIASQPWRLAPLVLLVFVVLAFQVLLTQQEVLT
jgi:peptide/nickel transport system permease protein